MTGNNARQWTVNGKTLLVELYELVLDWNRLNRYIDVSLELDEPYTERKTLYSEKQKAYTRIEGMGFDITYDRHGKPVLYPLFLPTLPREQEEGDEDEDE